ncbi:MAG: metallophosphoesterase [Chloroflexi bacterium]|nr:metallophosphoesterase [Chloroflexota bacterium]
MTDDYSGSEERYRVGSMARSPSCPREAVKVLLVADHPERSLEEAFDPERWRAQGIDLIISCGDLPAAYLSGLVSRLNVPLFYVRGNHDSAYHRDPPDGCDDIGGKLLRFRGWRFVGIDGMNRDGSNLLIHDEQWAAWRALRLRPQLWRAGGLDVLVTHSPPAVCELAYRHCPTPTGAGRICRFDDGRLCVDADDRSHWGYLAFREFIERYHPRFALHGHSHLTYARIPREQRVGPTRVVNAFGYHVVELVPDEGPVTPNLPGQRGGESPGSGK